MALSLVKKPRPGDGRRINHPDAHLVRLVHILARAAARDAMAQES